MGFRAECVTRGAALEAGNQEGEGLVEAITPLGCIGQVQAFRRTGILALIRHEVGMAAAHGLSRVFLVGEDVGAAGSQADAERHDEDQGGDAEIFPALVTDVDPEFRQEEEADHQEQVVGHLGMDAESDR